MDGVSRLSMLDNVSHMMALIFHWRAAFIGHDELLYRTTQQITAIAHIVYLYIYSLYNLRLFCVMCPAIFRCLKLQQHLVLVAEVPWHQAGGEANVHHCPLENLVKRQGTWRLGHPSFAGNPLAKEKLHLVLTMTDD